MKKISIQNSAIHGRGVFADEDIKSGEFISYITGPIETVRSFTPSLSKKSLNWIGIGRYTWINTQHSIYKSINHSCEPNTYISTRRTVRALTDIPKGHELTMDYSLTEADPGWCIEKCNCGTKNCRSRIEHIFSLPISFVRKNSHRIPKKFLDLYFRYHHLSPTDK